MATYVNDYSTGTVSPIVKKFMIGASIASPGILTMAPAAGNAGIIPCTTTAVTNTVGLSTDVGTYSTTQSASGTAVSIGVISNVHAIYAYRMCAGATAGVALDAQTTTSASSGGTAVTTAAEWSSPTYDEGVTWCVSGANVGQYRKITSVSATAGTVTVPFDLGIAIGDIFGRAPYWILDPTAKTIQFTSDFTEANANIAVGTGAAMVTVGFRLAGLADSYVLCTSNDHALNIATL
jgi:hypothetical protein